jgi:hypothetical protein
MSQNQKKAFWSIFIGFCVIATSAIYPQGAFENISYGGAIVLTILYFIVAIFIRLYVKSNADSIDKWFK